MPKRFHLEGQRFSRLLVTRRSGVQDHPRNQVLWDCRCYCGKPVRATTNALRQNHVRSCGCLVKDALSARKNDLTGQRFGKLTAIAPTDERVRNRVVWYCQCDCGKTTMVPSHDLRPSGKGTRSCGCLREDVNRARRNPDPMATHVQSLFTAYRTRARRTGHRFTLDRETFRKLATSDCSYCGEPPSTVRRRNGHPVELKYTGVDRVDTSAGYVPGNCVPCCWRCNRAKGGDSLGSFLAWVTQVHDHLTKQSLPRSSPDRSSPQIPQE